MVHISYRLRHAGPNVAYLLDGLVPCVMISDRIATKYFRIFK